MEVGVTESLRRDSVDVGGGDLGSVATEIGVAEVVAHHDDDVGSAFARTPGLRPGRFGGGEDPPDRAFMVRVGGEWVVAGVVERCGARHRPTRPWTSGRSRAVTMRAGAATRSGMAWTSRPADNAMPPTFRSPSASDAVNVSVASGSPSSTTWWHPIDRSGG